MQNPESILEKEIHKHPWDFEIQTDHLISARRRDQVIIKKTKKKRKKKKKRRTCWIVDFAVLADHRVKLKESEKSDKYLDLAREFTKTNLVLIDTNVLNEDHHHHVVPLAQISLTLFRHFSLSFIASGRSSGLHPVSSHSCCMYIRAGRPAFARPYMGAHRSASLMSSSLLFQQCPAYLVRLTWIVFVIGSRTAN